MAKHYIQYSSGEVYDFTFEPRMREGMRRISRVEYLKARPEYCKAEVAKLVKPGDTVYCVLRHVSSSGMQRRISFFVMVDNAPRCIDSFVSDILQYRNHDKGGLVVNGCGMDMGFHVVYSLSSALYGHTDRGGYNLKHAWL